MALVGCPECKKEISEQAPICPHCGHPLYSKRGLLKYGTKKIVIGSVVVIILIIGVSIAFDKFQKAPKGVAISEGESRQFNWWDYRNNRCNRLDITPYDIQRLFVNDGYTCKLIAKDEFILECEILGQANTYTLGIGANSKSACENLARRHDFTVY